MNDLLGGKEPREGEAVANLPKTKPGRLSAPPRTISRTCQKRLHLELHNQTKVNVATEAGQRNAWDVRARTTHLDEEETHRQYLRRAC